MRYPKFLPEHGTIGFVAPSFGCATEPYKSAFINAQNKLLKQGHGFILGENCYNAKGIGISNTPESCAEELLEMYKDETCDAIISCGGGELMCETIGKLDFEAIGKAEPKLFMGYSDNTNFIFLNTILNDVAGIYGPCAASFGMSEWHECLEDAYKLLKGEELVSKGYDKWEIEGIKDEEHPLAGYNVTEDKVLVYDGTVEENEDGKEAHFEGRLIGGCVDCLTTLTGTRFDKVAEFNEKYKEDGCIWFLECCDLNNMAIRRAFWQMKNAGWFETAKGFIIGRPRIYGEDIMGLDQYEAAAGALRDLNVPIIMDCDFGHLPPAMPLVCGAYAKVDAKNNDIKVTHIFK